VGTEDRELKSWCYESEEYVVIFIRKHGWLGLFKENTKVQSVSVCVSCELDILELKLCKKPGGWL